MMISKSKGAAAAARSFVFALMTGASVQTFSVAHAQPTNAQAPERETLIAFDIAPQPLASGLALYARQAGVRILFSYDAFDALSAPGVHGELTREEALARLLATSGYRGRIGADNVLQLDPPPRPQHASADDVLRIDQASAVSDDAPVETSAHASTDHADEETIVVTGTRIRGHHPVGSDIVVVDRQRIDDSGFTTTQEVLQSLPQNFGGSQNDANTLNGVSGSNFEFGSSIDLRGLGSDATLTLVNGRRIAPGGFGNFTDISNIPLVAVDRAEVLPDGASSVYGSDAVAGVVNVILRQPSDRWETAAQWGTADGGAETSTISQRMGITWPGGGLSAALEYRNRDRLAASARDYAASTDLRPFGGTDYRTSFANPGNIVQVGATPVQYAIPTDQNGLTLTQSQLLPGVVNRQNGREGTDLFPDQTSKAIYLNAEQEITPSIRFSAEALWGERNYRALDDDPTTTTLSVPQTNAYRQANGLFAGQGTLRIQYSFLHDLGPIVREGTARQAFVTAGIDADLPGDWRLNAYGAYADERDHGTFCCQVNSTALNAALASPVLSQAFNPFADGSNTSPDVLASLTRQDFTRQHSAVTTFAAKADGSLFEWAAGDVRAAVGGEWREESFDLTQIRTTALGAVTDQTSSRPGTRDVSALFGELLVPLIGAGGDAQPSLELSLSARYERYSDFGDTTNPKVGIRWSPIAGLDLRASYSTSFRAPQLVQLGSPSQGFVSEDPPSVDPLATGSGTNLLFIGGGSPNLKPETSENWSVGFDLAPTALPDLRLSLTYFSIAFANRISTPPNYVDAYTHPERFQGIFIRNPSQAQVDAYIAQIDRFVGALPGPGEVEAIFDNRLQNIASMDVSGVDFHGTYTWRTAFGAFDLDAAFTWLDRFDVDAGGLAPIVDRVNTVGGPVDFKSRITGGWSNGPWRFAAAWNFVDGYNNSTSALQQHVDSWSTVDLRLAYTLGSDHSATIALSVINAFDENPPFVDSSTAIGFDPANASPLGRFLSLSLRKTW